MFNGEALDDATIPLVDGYVHLHGHRVYAPWKILKAMDLSSIGGLNYTGIETLHGVEGLAPYEHGMIISRATVQRCSYALHAKADMVYPFKMQATTFGKCIKFEIEAVIRGILDAFKSEIAQDKGGVQLCFMIDAAELTQFSIACYCWC